MKFVPKWTPRKILTGLFLSLSIPGVQAETITMNAWVGKSDSQLYFSENAEGIELYRSSEPDCDIDNYSACNDGQMDIISNNEIDDTSFTLEQTGYFQFLKGDLFTSMELSSDRFKGTAYSSAIFFKDRLWLIGGIDYANVVHPSGTPTGKIWSTPDGKNWTEEAIIPELMGQSQPELLVFNNKIWALAEPIIGNSYNSIWSSEDGKEWKLETARPDFSPRTNYTSIVFNEKLWVFGGEYFDGDTTTHFNDVWFSEDGLNWQKTTDDAGFNESIPFKAVLNNNKIWLIGSDSVWSSADGTTWILATSQPQYQYRENFQALSHDNLLWMIGGDDGGGNDDEVWSSPDGINWSQVTENTGFNLREFPATASFLDKIWVIGGASPFSKAPFADAWSSEDGLNWMEETTNSQFKGVDEHQVVEHNGRYWLIGGNAGYDAYNLDRRYSDQVWSSSDGTNWTLEVDDADFGPIFNHAVVSFQGKLWIIGGYGGPNYGVNRRLWSSTNGVDWVLEGIPEFVESGAFWYNEAVVFNGRIWMIGGYDNRNANDKVWSSSDGITWTLELENAPFGGRYRHQLVTFNSQLWLIGGTDNETGKKNDVWSTYDGINWMKVTDSAGFSPRVDHTSIEFNDRIWVIGGLDGDSTLVPSNFKRDVWSSDDGKRWIRHLDEGQFIASRSSQAIKKDDRILLIGGSDENINFSNEVWSTSDGRSWSKAYRQTIEITPVQ